MNVQYSHFIGGEGVVGSSTDVLDVFNPATGDRIARVNAAGEAEIDAAVSAARDAFERGEWQGRTVHERSAILWQLADRIAGHREELAHVTERAEVGPRQGERRDGRQHPGRRLVVRFPCGGGFIGGDGVQLVCKR